MFQSVHSYQSMPYDHGTVYRTEYQLGKNGGNVGTSQNQVGPMNVHTERERSPHAILPALIEQL